MAEWKFCPECGCEEILYEQGQHKQCKECHQEWFSDVDYSDAVAKNLGTFRAALSAKDAEIARLREALEYIRDIEPAQFNAYPADWNDQIKACEKCQSFRDHPLFRGICDTHRQPMYRRDAHDAHQVRALGYRAKSMARDALSPPLMEKADV